MHTLYIYNSDYSYHINFSKFLPPFSIPPSMQVHFLSSCLFVWFYNLSDHDFEDSHWRLINKLAGTYVKIIIPESPGIHQ